MKAAYPVQSVPVTPEYILASIQEEWWQVALLDGYEPEDTEKEMPTFSTTIHEWRDVMDLLGWRALGKALDEAWGTEFSREQWRDTLEPAREKTLRGVCELLASQAKRPVAPPVKLLGHDCRAAGIFLAIRSLLIEAGGSSDARPSTALKPFLRRYSGVFLGPVARLAPGGLPFAQANQVAIRLCALSSLMAVLLFVGSSIWKEPGSAIAGVVLFGASWLGGWLVRGPLKLEHVDTFRGLTELIVKLQKQAHVEPGNA
jgi:hypothetical protein